MSKLKIDEFGPELLNLLKVGYTQAVSVEVPTRAEAISLRYRINMLRSRIRDSKREDVDHLRRVQAVIRPDPRTAGEDYKGKWVITVSPPDQNLAPYIQNALKGITVPEGDAPDLSGMMDDGVDTLPEGAGEPPQEVKESEAWPLPNTHLPPEEKS